MKENVLVMLGELTTINLSDLDASKLVSTAEVVASDGRKRPLSEDVTTEVTSKEPWIEERGRRAKKFRTEWMNEVYFKDWLQPHPTDDTYCICIACDIRLRCGKSELEKHASGLKHCRRVDAMKENPNRNNTGLTILSEGSQTQAGEHILCEENGTFYMATGGEQLEEQQDSGDSAAALASAAAETALSKALLKLSKHLDNNSDMARRKMQMLETEHHRRMQVLNKELELRSLEVLIRQTELQKLNNCVTMKGTTATVELPSMNEEEEEKY